MARKVRLWWALAAAVAILAAVHVVRTRTLESRLLRADPDVVPDDARLSSFAALRGRSMYERHCAACHRTNGRGDSRWGVPDLTDGDWLYGSGKVSEIEAVILHGIRAHAPKTWNLAVMPAYARARANDATVRALPPGDLQDVTEYLLALRSLPHDVGRAHRGALVFAGRGACYDCHAIDGRGDPAIGAPNLTDGIWLYGDGSREAIIDTLEKGRQGICPAWAGRLDAASIRETAVYVHSLSRRGGAP